MSASVDGLLGPPEGVDRRVCAFFRFRRRRGWLSASLQETSTFAEGKDDNAGQGVLFFKLVRLVRVSPWAVLGLLKFPGKASLLRDCRGMAKEIANNLAWDGEDQVGKRLPVSRRLRVGIIDADLGDHGTRHPNLALMKLSGWLKQISQYMHSRKTGYVSDGMQIRDLYLHFIDPSLF